MCRSESGAATLITRDDCLRALDLYSEALLRRPNVQGVGIGAADDESDVECLIVVYLAFDDPVGIPDELLVTCANGRSKQVPVRVELQGPLLPE